MPTIAQQLAANEAELRAAWGASIPAVTPEVTAAADAAAERVLAASPEALADGELPDWAQGISYHLLAQLASAYRDKGDERYAETARVLYGYWLDLEPVEKGWRPPPDYNALIIPHRLGDTEVVGWFGALPDFSGSPHFDEALLERILASARVQLNHLAWTLHEARNIRMSQTDALLTQGLRLSFLPDSARWRDVGLRGLNDMFHRQFHPDGSSIEATGWYHYICANMALRFWRLKQARPDMGLQVTADLVAKAFDYTTASVQPDGEFTRIGDCTATVVPHKMLESVLALRRSVRAELGAPAGDPPLSQCFPHSGQAMLRDGWGADATYVTFDATPCLGYHWHPARNAIQVHAHGSRIIADPGRMSYQRTLHRQYACSTRGHSTVNFNGWDQSRAASSFRHRAAEGYDVVDALYSGGYWPMREMEHGAGVFGEHHRTLLWIRGRAIVVIDSVCHTQGEGEKPDIETNWQFGPGALRLETGGRGAVFRHERAGLLLLPALVPAGAESSVHEGETDPCAGWVADRSDRPVPAPLLRVRAPQHDFWNADMASILIPFAGDRVPEVAVEETRDPASGRHGMVRLRWGDGVTDEVWWTRRLRFALERVGDICTDAALVHISRADDGNVKAGLVYEGTHLDPHSRDRRASPQTFVV